MADYFKCKFDKAYYWESGKVYDIDENTQIMYIANSRIDNYPLFKLVKGDFDTIKDGISLTLVEKLTGSVKYIETDHLNEKSIKSRYKL
jgi:hypothetical protein